MTQNLNPEFVHLELGDYLELLQNTIPVGGKRLSDKEICRKISMSPQTYGKVKGQKFKTEPVLQRVPHLPGRAEKSPRRTV